MYRDLLVSQGATNHWSLDSLTDDEPDTIGTQNLVRNGFIVQDQLSPVNRGTRFNTANGFLSSDYTSSMAFNAFAPFSVSFMLAAAELSGAPQGLISHRVSSAGGKHWGVFLYFDGKLVVDTGANDARWTTEWIPTLNQWHHVAVTYEPSDGNRRLYVDGEYHSAQGSPSISGSGTAPISIGALGGSGSSYARSSMDEVAVFMGKRLSDAEVRAQAAAVLPVRRVLDGGKWRGSPRRTF